MSRCLVLVVVCCWWSVLVGHSLQCETGVAFVDSILSVPRSLMANADVAVLKTYNATSVKQCMEDCCNGMYGACSVATFKKKPTTENCIHFNCRPLSKCKFLSAASTNSFSFSGNPTSPKPVPSEHNPTTSTPLHRPTTEEDVEQFALKNDNTTIKPRKGVDDPIIPGIGHPGTEETTPFLGLIPKSGIKPRKGVNFEDVPHSKFLSNVKARKGVGPYSTSDSAGLSTTSRPHPLSDVVTNYPFTPTTQREFSTAVTDDLLADLAKILADDSESSSLHVTSTSTTEVLGSTSTWSPTTTVVAQTTGVPPLLFSSEIIPSRSTTPPESSTTPIRTSALPVLRQTTLWSSVAVTTASEPPVVTPTLQTLNADYTGGGTEYKGLGPKYTGVEHEVAMDKLMSSAEEEHEEEEEEEADRKYKSSIHLVLSLVFGLLVLFAVLGVVAKRVYDGWLRRDYYRMNYLIDGIYNGVD